MKIENVAHANHLLARWTLLNNIVQGNIPNVRIEIGGQALFMDDEGFLSELGDILYDERERLRGLLEELGVEFPETSA